MEKTAKEVMDEVLADLQKGPFVYREDGAYIFLPHRDRPHQYYDIGDSVCKSADDVVDWIAHLSEKRWVTTKHIEQFCLLAMTQLGIRRR